MKKLFSFILMLLCIAGANAQQQVKTYYYELVKVVDEKGIEEDRSKDGQFYTITHNTCYESNNEGMDEGLGHLSYVGENKEMKQHVYRGTSFYGKETTFFISLDYSRINIKTSAGMTYVLSRKTAPKDYVASNHKEIKAWIESILNGGGTPPIPTTVYPTSTTDNTPSGHRRCPGCNGTGYCSLCKGKGWYKYQGEIYDCPSCHHTGRCGVCHGKGHCN